MNWPFKVNKGSGTNISVRVNISWWNKEPGILRKQASQVLYILVFAPKITNNKPFSESYRLPNKVSQSVTHTGVCQYMKVWQGDDQLIKTHQKKTRQQRTLFHISFIVFLKSLHQPKERTVQMKEYLSEKTNTTLKASCTRDRKKEMSHLN